MPAQCRTSSGLRDSAEISDISAQGCCVRTKSLFFRVGSRVTIRPVGIEGLPGVVRWISGECAGVEFDRPIYGPILEHLAQLHRSGDQVPVSRG